jgi:dihydroflavonol-4-reductase
MILVTGGTGFLGSYLVEALYQQGQLPLRILYHTTLPKIKLPDVEYIACDLTEVDAVWEIMKNVTQVYHCANRVSFDNYDADLMMKINAEGTANLVNAALEYGIEKFLHVSSVAAIGRLNGQKNIDEKSEWVYNDSTSAYAFSKHYAETEVWRGQCEGLNTVIVNPSIILGAGDADRSSVQLFKNAWNEFPYYTSGINGFVDVKDVVKSMILLMKSSISNERFIINGGNFEYKKILQLMANAMQRKEPTKLANKWMSEVAWRLFALRKFFTGKRALITKETARTANQEYFFSNEKLLKAIPEFSYTPIEQTLERVGAEMRKIFLAKK